MVKIDYEKAAEFIYKCGIRNVNGKTQIKTVNNNLLDVDILMIRSYISQLMINNLMQNFDWKELGMEFNKKFKGKDEDRSKDDGYFDYLDF